MKSKKKPESREQDENLQDDQPVQTTSPEEATQESSEISEELGSRALEQIQEELEAYKDKYLRLYAEFDNARKRMEREKMEFVRYANRELLLEMLDVVDSLEMSIKSADARQKEVPAFMKGTELVLSKVFEILKRHDVHPVKAVGQKFDHDCHEVLMQEETDQFEEGTVMEEFQKGYKMADRVLRTAKVKLARAKEFSEVSSSSETDESEKENKTE